jgi:hypothetical protein
VTFPLELYYFNQKLAFFEPAIERVVIKTHIVNDNGGKQEVRLLIEDVLNINFSVALYENIFVLMENLKTERDQYTKIVVEQAEKESLYAQIKQSVGASQAQDRQQSDYTNENEIYLSTATNFIKNKTGEILLFKAGRQPAFTEMQANETLPLDFQRNQGLTGTGNFLSGTEESGSKMGLFDGVASSEMQPDSDAMS